MKRKAVTMIKSLKVYKKYGRDFYDVNGLTDNQVKDLIKELNYKYYQVDTMHFGIYLSNDKCFGYIACK
jgi:hypothetical protein